MIRGSIHQEIIIIINTDAPNKKAEKHIEQKLAETEIDIAKEKQTIQQHVKTPTSHSHKSVERPCFLLDSFQTHCVRGLGCCEDILRLRRGTLKKMPPWLVWLSGLSAGP